MYAYIAYMVTDTVIPEKTVCQRTGVVVVVLVHVGYCLFLLFIIIIIIIPYSMLCYTSTVIAYYMQLDIYKILYFGTLYCIKGHFGNPFFEKRKNLSE